MQDTTATGNYYTISHIILLTGLTDRTIRNYISSGLLAGEKINGLWHFTPEQVEAFIHHPTVYPSIQAKSNSIVYDFLADRKKASPAACVILDLPGEDPKTAAEFFCFTISNGDFHDLRFSFDSVSGVPRIILRGDTREVMGLVNQYYKR